MCKREACYMMLKELATVFDKLVAFNKTTTALLLCNNSEHSTGCASMFQIHEIAEIYFLLKLLKELNH